MENKIKELRVKIDGLSQLIKEFGIGYIIRIDKLPNSLKVEEVIQSLKSNGFQLLEQDEQPLTELNNHNIEKAYDNLILSKEWLGELLFEATDDKANFKEFKPSPELALIKEITNYKGFTNEAKIEYLIKEVNKTANSVLELESGKLTEAIWTDYMHEIKLFAYKNLCEARFYLQFELKQLHDDKNSNN